MTQENKLELIDYLIDELAKEVEKQGLSLALAIKVEDDIVLTGSLRDAEELSECISILAEDFEDRVGVHYKDFKKKLDECDCPGCKARRGENVSDEVIEKFLDTLFEVSKEGGLDD